MQLFLLTSATEGESYQYPEIKSSFVYQSQGDIFVVHVSIGIFENGRVYFYLEAISSS